VVPTTPPAAITQAATTGCDRRTAKDSNPNAPRTSNVSSPGVLRWSATVSAAAARTKHAATVASVLVTPHTRSG
jgi:hypothetical protein